MIRAKSAQSKIQMVDIEMLDEQLNHQVKKASLLDGDRNQFWKQAEDTKTKNKQFIEKLKSENKRLQQTKEELMNTKKGFHRANSFSSFTSEIKDQNFWRRQLDKQKHISKTKKKMLLGIQDMLKEVEDAKTGYIEQSPLMKNIRILENRLDKVMIKYNQAQSIKKTYQQIVKRLKQERVGYDNQLATIQQSLKGKEHDFEELLLLAHDATHAKQLALMEMKKYENKKCSIQELRTKYLEQKKQALTIKKYHKVEQQQKQVKVDQRQKIHVLQNVINYKEQTNYQKQQLNDYQDAFRKLKEVTGVLDANQIIQKFKTQNLTTNSFEELKEGYKNRIEQLKKQKMELKERLNTIKLYGNGNKNLQTIQEEKLMDRKKINDIENDLSKKKASLEKIKLKQQRAAKILINTIAGIEHLSKHLQFVKIPDYQTVKIQQNPEIELKQINSKLGRIYKVVRNDSDFEAELFKQSLPKLQEFLMINLRKDDEVILQKNNRLKNFKEQQEDQSDNDFEEDAFIENAIKIKQRNLTAAKSMDHLKRNSLAGFRRK